MSSATRLRWSKGRLSISKLQNRVSSDCRHSAAANTVPRTEPDRATLPALHAESACARQVPEGLHALRRKAGTRTLLVCVVDNELANGAYHLHEGFMSPRESLEFACRPGRRL